MRIAPCFLVPSRGQAGLRCPRVRAVGGAADAQPLVGGVAEAVSFAGFELDHSVESFADGVGDPGVASKTAIPWPVRACGYAGITVGHVWSTDFAAGNMEPVASVVPRPNAATAVALAKVVGAFHVRVFLDAVEAASSAERRHALMALWSNSTDDVAAVMFTTQLAAALSCDDQERDLVDFALNGTPGSTLGDSGLLLAAFAWLPPHSVDAHWADSPDFMSLHRGASFLGHLTTATMASYRQVFDEVFAANNGIAMNAGLRIPFK